MTQAQQVKTTDVKGVAAAIARIAAMAGVGVGTVWLVLPFILVSGAATGAVAILIKTLIAGSASYGTVSFTDDVWDRVAWLVRTWHWNPARRLEKKCEMLDQVADEANDAAIACVEARKSLEERLLETRATLDARKADKENQRALKEAKKVQKAEEKAQKKAEAKAKKDAAKAKSKKADEKGPAPAEDVIDVEHTEIPAAATA